MLLTHYAELHTPPEVSMGHWKISPKMVRAYIKTDKWKQVVEAAAKAAAARATQKGLKPRKRLQHGRPVEPPRGASSEWQAEERPALTWIRTTPGCIAGVLPPVQSLISTLSSPIPPLYVAKS